MRKVKPMEVYNLAAQSHVTRSFECPSLTAETNAVGVIHLLESIRNCGLKSSRVYQASSSEMFGNSGTASQNESTPLAPRSPYGVAKVGAHWTIANYREAYNMYAASGICFNHESPRRGRSTPPSQIGTKHKLICTGRSFVSRRITLAIARIHHGEADCLYLANLDSQRDWGHARDYVEAMWLILQQPSPSDYVLASGRSYSIRQFVGKAFLCVGLKIRCEALRSFLTPCSDSVVDRAANFTLHVVGGQAAACRR
jgi:GDPmannose 4,6-dehydratase